MKENTIKKLSVLLFIMILISSCHRKELPAYCIDGIFFRQPPKGVSMMDLVQSHRGTFLTDHSENRVHYLILDKGKTLSEAAIAYRIPDKRVKNREEFLYKKEAFDKIVKMQLTTAQDIDRPRTLKVGESLPGEFHLMDLDDTEWNKERLKGRITVINLWFSGCGPCLKEFPTISKWKKEYPDVTFLSANFEDKDVVKRVTKARQFTWTHLYNDDYFSKYLDGEGFPMFLVLDQQGIIRYFENGATVEVQSEVLKCIQTLRDKATE